LKHDELRAIAHNVATSLAGGCSFIIGVYDVDILGAVRQAPEGEVTVDFLNGTTSSTPLARTAVLFQAALPAFCEKHGVAVSAFREMSARYRASDNGLRFVVRVVDQSDRATETEYGWFGERAKTLDGAGRIRPKPIQRS
jgi:hypothetical protein